MVTRTSNLPAGLCTKSIHDLISSLFPCCPRARLLHWAVCLLWSNWQPRPCKERRTQSSQCMWHLRAALVIIRGRCDQPLPQMFSRVGASRILMRMRRLLWRCACTTIWYGRGSLSACFGCGPVIHIHAPSRTSWCLLSASTVHPLCI